jgi:DNA-binding XRE family transcriptional regulator
MKKKETVAMQDEYINALIKNLPVLRAAAKVTQAQLADKVGVSCQTIVSIETKKRPMPWTLYLAMVFVFERYEESKKLLESFELFQQKLIE